MAMITCPECGAQVSDQATACIKCGYPIKKAVPRQGKAVFKASKEFIGLASSYAIMDARQNVLAKVKPGESFETKINGETVFYVKLKGYPSAVKEVTAHANEVNRFAMSPSQSGMGLAISRVDVIDSD